MADGTEPTGMMEAASTALVLIGFQNEYFAPRGRLRDDIEDINAADLAVAATERLVAGLVSTEVLVVATPIVFTPSYAELINPVGILAAIKAKHAFQRGTAGARMVGEFERFGSRIIEVEGRRGLNAFSNTGLDDLLSARAIVDVVLAGALTSVCVDSTGRSAQERDYRVSVLSDCTLGRTRSEQDLFCRRIFPLYAEVVTSAHVLERLVLAGGDER